MPLFLLVLYGGAEGPPFRLRGGARFRDKVFVKFLLVEDVIQAVPKLFADI
jgi:hypothetical protein